MELREAVDKYLLNLHLRTESKDTKKGYSNMLRNDFIPYMEERYGRIVNVDELTVLDIEEYIRYRKDIKKAQNISINRNIYILRSLYKYLVSRNIIEKDIAKDIEPLKVKQKEREVLSLEEIDELIGAIEHKTVKIAVKVLSLTGLRISELCNLKLSDVDLEERIIYITNGKGFKDRKVPIAENLVPELENYKKQIRCNIESKVFFALEKTGSISPQYINLIIKDATKKLNWDKNITAHNLRHSVATNLLRHGANIVDVGKILGHKDLRTTSIYLHSNIDELKNSIDLLSK